MKKQIKLYTTTCYQAYMMDEQGTRFTLKPWGNDTEAYKGYSDSEALYYLPEGYTIDKLADGGKAIFDTKNDHCTIVTEDEAPVLVSLAGIIPLEKVVA